MVCWISCRVEECCLPQELIKAVSYMVLDIKHLKIKQQGFFELPSL